MTTVYPDMPCPSFNCWAEHVRIQIYSHYISQMEQPTDLGDLSKSSRDYFEWAVENHDNGKPYHIQYHLHRVAVALADLNNLINKTVQ